MGKEVLLEIGTEELPAGFLPKALNDINEVADRKFKDGNISHGRITSMGTPRRLFVGISDVAEKQADQIIEKLGPAKRVCFDAAGAPTAAASGFARGQRVEVSELETAVTPKGEYVCVRKKISGDLTENILPGLLTGIISEIPLGKSMRWADFDFRFARPIRWILAVYGGEIIPFEIAGVQSGALSYGHRFMCPSAFSPATRDEYSSGLRKNCVIVDPQERKKTILSEIKKAAQEVGGAIFNSEELLETVVFLTEYPTVVCGSFDRSFLRLPQEVLTTTMISHQKYFPLTDENGSLLPYFIAVNNTLARDPVVVKRGNERVIRARLSDASFFYETDRKMPLPERIHDLKKIVFHTLLGTSYEKVLRIQELASWIADVIDPALKQNVERAALLAKADLTTLMVGEFAELQGIMGREYALLAGENPHVAKAIYEHYLPLAAGGALPETNEGAIVSIADKLDSICGFFGVGLIPTGTADPYALRRQALGIINIILAKRYPLSLGEMIEKSLSILSPFLKNGKDQIKAAVLDFFKGRIQSMMLSELHPYDVIDAVLSTPIDDIVSTYEKIAAMESFKLRPDYQQLALTFKRVENITRGYDEGVVHPELFGTPEEKELYENFLAVKKNVRIFISNADFGQALMELARLQKPVDTFFETVLVMAKEDDLRVNRLSLLKEISSLFHTIADFSKIVAESEAKS
jgi:glycyl-tRNA synthetase beta chain